MAWGLGLLEDLVGRSSVEAATKAFNNSRFKGTVDDVTTGLGNLATTVENKYNQFQDTAALNRAAREQQQYAANKARLEMANAIPAYAQNDSLEDRTGDFIGLGGARVVNAANKAKVPVHPGLSKTIQFEKRPLQPMRSDDLGDIAYKQVNSKVNNYGQDMTRHQFQMDDVARQVAIDEGRANALHTARIRQANKAAEIPASAWDAINSTQAAERAAKELAASKYLNGLMAPNHPIR